MYRLRHVDIANFASRVGNFALRSCCICSTPPFISILSGYIPRRAALGLRALIPSVSQGCYVAVPKPFSYGTLSHSYLTRVQKMCWQKIDPKRLLVNGDWTVICFAAHYLSICRSYRLAFTGSAYS